MGKVAGEMGVSAGMALYLCLLGGGLGCKVSLFMGTKQEQRIKEDIEVIENWDRWLAHGIQNQEK